MDMEPTYFLFSGRLFHACAAPYLENVANVPKPHRGERATPEPPPPPSRGESADDSAYRQPRRSEDPGPLGPEGERVGEDGEDDEESVATERMPGPCVTTVPDRDAPDAEPFEPRALERHSRGPAKDLARSRKDHVRIHIREDSSTLLVDTPTSTF